MKRILLPTFIAAAAATAAYAGVETYPLGPANTLIKISEPQRYLILPVQESMPDSKVDILVDGNIAGTIYVRLADSNIDYTVPLDLTPYGEGDIVLNVVSEVDRTHSRNASDFIAWERLAMADTFDTANRERFRPAFHHTPLYGWMNDPNGMFYKDGVWHLYYQYNPYGSKWQNMTWGHSTSTDLVNWEHQPLAILPNGLGSIFSGSAVVDANNTAGMGDSTVVALYTSAAHSQIQSMSYSHDNGQTFTFYPANPVIANPTEARDPKVFWHEPTGQWVMALAHALDHEMQFYTSPDLINWTLQSAFGKGYGSQDGVWECPDLFELEVEGTGEKKWVLLCNINPGAPMGGSGTQYFIGDFDGRTFTPDHGPEVDKWMDYGKDHYATVTWSNAPEGRRTALGWMSNWQYANEVPTRQFRSANTLPRDLSLFRAPDGDIYLASRPSPEVETLRTADKEYKRTSVTATPKVYPLPALSEVSLEYNVADCRELLITLYNDRGEKVEMTLDARRHTFTVDRRESGITDFSAHFPAVTTAPMLTDAKRGALRIFIDHSSVEVFDAEGRFVITDLVFPNEPYSHISFSARGGKATVDDLTIYTLK